MSYSKPETLITIDPEQYINIKGPFSEPQKSSVTVKNVISDIVAFKIVTNDPTNIEFDPQAGILLPNQTKMIGIVFGPCDYEEDMKQSIRFVISAMIISQEQNDKTADVWSSANTVKNITEQILTVVLKPDPSDLTSPKKKRHKLSDKLTVSSYEDDKTSLGSLSPIIFDQPLPRKFDAKSRSADPNELKKTIEFTDKELEIAKQEYAKLRRHHSKTDKAKKSLEADYKARLKDSIKNKIQTMYGIQIFTLTCLIVFISYYIHNFVMKYVEHT